MNERKVALHEDKHVRHGLSGPLLTLFMVQFITIQCASVTCIVDGKHKLRSNLWSSVELVAHKIQGCVRAGFVIMRGKIESGSRSVLTSCYLLLIINGQGA